MNANAEVVTIGDELLSGETCDTNASWIDGALCKIGYRCVRHTTVADDVAAIADAIDLASRRVPIVIVSGGLGPTQDDVTMEGLARALNVRLVQDERVLLDIRARFAARQLTMTPNNERQAMVPEHGEVLVNQAGTAPGFLASLNGASIFLVPGVPREMRWMFDEIIRPRIAKEQPAVLRKTLKVIGIGESRVEHLLVDVIKKHARIRFGFRTLGAENHVKLAADPHDEASLCAAASDVSNALFGKVFGEDDDVIEQVVGKLLDQSGATVAIAESCTGGLVTQWLTEVAGASNYVKGSIVAYSNEAKIALLGVDRTLVDRVGAVSEEVASAMATGVRERMNAIFGISTTGIAGPTGATPQKPVGLVFIGVATGAGVTTHKMHGFGDRRQIRSQAAAYALEMLRRQILSGRG